jgi:uncharacterized membrane protein
VRTARHFARISHVLLLVLGAGGLVWQAPADTPATAMVLFALAAYLPLALFLPATLGRRDARLLTWFCFLLLVYFCGFVMQATEPAPLRTLALARIGVLVVLFCSCLWLIRGPRGGHD